MRIGKLPVETTLEDQQGTGTQPFYKAPGDLQVKIVGITVINIRLVRLSP